ncbi:hypothetical protein LCGC14_1985620 [marine sediment metagenome]|uniref:Uncharacterized protein n=1 Tax=marine sediment metagenome TaxID=412755 RepID=A0A0F9F7J0_9ZZZZ
MQPTKEVRKRYGINHPEKIKENNDRTNKFAFRYKNKTIYLGYNPRKGICQVCSKEGKTVLHHIKYDDSDPLAHTTEVCYKCHKKIHDDIHKLNQEDAEKWNEYLEKGFPKDRESFLLLAKESIEDKEIVERLKKERNEHELDCGCDRCQLLEKIMDDKK